MTYTIISPPALPPVTLAETRAHLRLGTTDEDELLSGLIAAAAAFIEKETAVALITRTLRLWIDDLPLSGIVELPSHPVQRIVSVTLHDETGQPQTVPGSSYFLNAIARPARLRFDRASLPTGFCNGIEIDFDAGFGDLGTDIPDLVKRAILMLVAHWYEFRGVYGANEQPVAIPPSVERLINHYRMRRL